ncbi:hypothetical protein FACUT_6380 [Fusarium acutatum]|uniref:Uncharacterized protein n=1 Tax=Fusarium acutatum TaxID=78861 RepID=A0A8H4JPH0_9HYPO|nr:hypothetical protein FACUT_6380 [Fusarium acutatum]
MFEPSSTLLLTNGKGDHFELLQSIEEDLPSSRAQSIPLGPTKTCIGDEDGSPCPSMIESDDSSVEDIEVRKAFACPYFRLDPVRHIECLSRKLYRIQDVKQHLSRRHYMERDKSSNASDNTRGIEDYHQKGNGTRSGKLCLIGNCQEKGLISGSSRVVPGILRSLGLSNEKGKSVQQLMEELFSGFQELSDERSNDTETEETEKASTCGGVDSIPMTPKDMEFEFDFNVPLHRSSSPEIQNSYSSKDMTQIQESNAVIPTGLPDYTTFEGNGEDDILMRYLPTKFLEENVLVKPPCTASTSDSPRKSLKGSGWEYAWECDYCGFEYIFKPSGAGSDMRCFNYPCLGQFRGNFCSFYKVQI